MKKNIIIGILIYAIIVLVCFYRSKINDLNDRLMTIKTITKTDQTTRLFAAKIADSKDAAKINNNQEALSFILTQEKSLKKCKFFSDKTYADTVVLEIIESPSVNKVIADAEENMSSCISAMGEIVSSVEEMRPNFAPPPKKENKLMLKI